MNIVTKTTTPTKPIFTLLFIVFFSILGVGNALAANEDKPYVVKKYNAANNYYDLVFYYNDEYNSVSNGEVIFIIDDNPTWINDGDKINSVYITNTFKSYKPKNCARWFKGVADIDGLYNLNTSECTSMEEMFINSTAPNIDVSDFNTNQVITMKDMFKGCSNITTLSFSNLNTSKVTDMSGMFCDCTNLNEFRAANFNTTAVTDMSSMFEGCYYLHPAYLVDLLQEPNFTTQKVTNMSNMFKGCSGYATFTKTLDFKYFNTEQVTDFSGMFEDCTFIDILDIHTFSSASAQNMSNMFKNCRNLKTIYVSSNWKPENLPENQQDMYAGCDKLPTDDPLNIYGEIYVTLNGTTLTFHYDLNKLDYSTTYAPIAATSDPNDPIIPEWLSINPSVTKVVFLEEFKDARPTTCSCWFKGCTELTEIEGLNYLNLYNVDDISSMFQDCAKLKMIDLRSFKTDKVSYMYYMFSGCVSLKTILISDKWSTEGLGSKWWNEPTESQMHASSSEMFLNCTELIGDDGTCADPECVNSTTRDYKGNYQFQYAHANKGGYMTKDYVKVFNYLDEFEELNPRTHKKETIKQWKKYDNVNVNYEKGTITLPTITPPPFYWHGDKLYGWATIDNNNQPDTIKIQDESKEINLNEIGLTNGHYEFTPVFLHPYAEFKDGTLTFKFDTKKTHKDVEDDNNDNKNLIFDVIYYNGSGARDVEPYWMRRKNEITTVTFDKSFNEYQLEEFVSTGDGTHYCGCEGWFTNFTALKKVDFTNFNASKVTTMNEMFAGCTSLETITLNINTESVIYMQNMFYGCVNLKTINFGKDFSTSNVTDMHGMFNGCLALENLDLSAFNTINVTDMSDMFSYCASLKELDLSSFNTSAVTSMFRMFDMVTKFTPTWDDVTFDYQPEVEVEINLETIFVGKYWNVEKAIANDKNDDLFTGCTKLIGGSNISYNPNNTGYAYANAKTGYLTKLPYTIEYKDAETDELLSEAITANLPSEIKGEKTITINPPSRKGYVFKGWTDGLNGNTGLDKTKPSYATDTITIDPSTAKYNHVYVAHWEKLTIDVNLQSSDHLFYPIDSVAFCNNNESGLTLNFKANLNSPLPAHYTLSFNSDEIQDQDQQGDVSPDANNGEFTVLVNIPDYTLSDDYIGKIVFADDDEVSFSDPIEFTLTTNIPHKDVILYLYSNVIFVSNQSGRYNDASYQWFKDGNPVGEKRQYFTEPVISGSYGARINIAGQKPIYTCALVDNTVKVASSVVKVFPNPALAGKEFTVEIMNYTPGVEYKILVFSNNGAQVRSIATTEATTTLSLPRGIYNIALTANGNKCGAFKIIVEE